MTEREMQELQERLMKSKEVQERREKLRARDAKKLLALDEYTIGRACKELTKAAIFMLGKEDEAEAFKPMTYKELEAYDLLMHLIYEDWESDADGE